jgi:hypothetical protein
MQQQAQEMQQCRDNLAAQEARFQQQRADNQQHKKEAPRKHVKELAGLQAESQDAIETLGDKVKRLAVQRPDLASPSSIKLPRDRSTFKQWKHG